MATALDTTVALVTLAELKEFLKVSTTTDDVLFNVLINSASRLANSYTGRQLLSKSHTHYYDGSGSSELIVAEYPIVSVTTLNDDTNRDFGSGDNISSANYMLDKEAGIIRLWNAEASFVKGDGTVKLVFSAGYAVADVPADLKLAVMRLCAIMYEKALNRRHDVVSESVGDRTTTFTSADIPGDVRTMLAPYKSRYDGTRFFRG